MQWKWELSRFIVCCMEIHSGHSSNYFIFCSTELCSKLFQVFIFRWTILWMRGRYWTHASYCVVRLLWIFSEARVLLKLCYEFDFKTEGRLSHIPVGLWWNWNDWICILLMLKWVCMGNEGMALIVKMERSINHTVALSSEWNMDFRNTLARGEYLTNPPLPYFTQSVSNISGLRTPGVWQ